jgi:predicted ATPase
MTAGKEYLQSDSQKYEVAELNLIAGKQTLKTFTFSSAAAYLLSGIELLPDDCWEHKYNLSLNLYNGAIEASYNAGDFGRLRSLVSKTLAKANTFKDKLNAHQNHILLLKSSCLMSEAVSKCLFLIRELGEELPSEQLATEALVFAEYTHAKNMLMTRSEEELLRLHVMNDPQKIETMECLRTMTSSSVNAQFNLGAIAIFRMVKLSIEWGLCDTSAFAFAAYGSFLCKTHDYEGAYGMGKVAVKLLNRLSLKAHNRVRRV